MKLSEFVSRLWSVARQGNANGTAKVFLQFPAEKGRYVLLPISPTEVLRDTDHGIVVVMDAGGKELRKAVKTVTADLVADTAEEQHEKSFEEGFNAGVTHCKDALESHNHQKAHAALSLYV